MLKIATELAKVKATVSKISDEKAVQPVAYNSVASRQLDNNLNNLNNIVNTLHKEKIESNPIEVKSKQDRTIIVKRYCDKKIRNSGDVRKEVNKEFPGSVIRNARTTAGGSIVLEFDDPETASNVAGNWKNTMFGGNNGVMRGNKPTMAGIIKHVYSRESEEDIIQEITQKYPNCEVDLFKRSNKFTGTIKVTFSNEEELQDVLDNRIQIFEQIYLVERYKFKPRVIKCNHCQKF